MGARRKPQPTEVELVKALCNSDEITRLTQINTALTYKNTEVIQTNINLETTLTELKKIIEANEVSKNRLQAKLEESEEELETIAKNYTGLEIAHEQRVQELNAITSKWWYKLFS